MSMFSDAPVAQTIRQEIADFHWLLRGAPSGDDLTDCATFLIWAETHYSSPVATVAQTVEAQGQRFPRPL
jgi:hypothetical protein